MRPDDPQSEAFALMDSHSVHLQAENTSINTRMTTPSRRILCSPFYLLSQISKGNHEAEASEEVRADADAQIIFI